MTKAELVAKRDKALLRHDANWSKKPRWERDYQYYDDTIEVIWATYTAKMARLEYAENLKEKGAEK